MISADGLISPAGTAAHGTQRDQDKYTRSKNMHIPLHATVEERYLASAY